MNAPLTRGFTLVAPLLLAGQLAAQIPGTVLWELPNTDAWTTPALGTNGTVYFGDAAGRIQAVSASGASVWSRDLAAVLTTPVSLGADGALLMGTGGHKLRALRPDGSDFWELDTPKEVAAPLAVARDGTVYYVCADDRVYAVSALGSNLWSFASGSSWLAPAIGSDGTLYVGGPEGVIYALWPDGSERWRHRLANAAGPALALGADDTIYVADWNERLYAIDASGTKKWDLLLPGFVSFAPMVVAPDGTVFVAGTGGKLAAVSSAGVVKWQIEAGGSVSAGLALGADEVIYYGTREGLFQAVDALGKPLWQFTNQSGFFNAPVLTTDARIYLGWLRLWAIAASAGPAETGWPMLQRDAQHTGRARGRPLVAWVEPQDGARFLPGANVQLETTVTAAEAPVTGVEFKADGQTIGSATQPPYRWVWPDVPAGQHGLTAVVTDALGFSRTSAVVNITVTSEPLRYPIETGAWGSGRVDRSPARTEYELGSSVLLTAVAGAWHGFERWTDSEQANPRTVIVGSSNRYVGVFTNTLTLQTHLLPRWDAAFGGRGDDWLTAVAPATDGGWFVGGFAPQGNSGNKFLPGHGDQDFWVVKVGPNGAKIWEAAPGGTARDELTALVALPDGGCLVGGSSKSGVSGNKETASFGGYDYWVVRLDSAGRRVWERAFGGNLDDVLTALAVLPGGGFVAAGYSSSTAGGNKMASAVDAEDFWVVRLDAQGERVSDHTFGRRGNDRCQALLVLPDGSLLLGGNTAGSGPTIDYSDFWVLRLDHQFNVVWQRSYGGSGEDGLWRLAATPDGGFLFAGDSSSGAGRDKTTPGYGYTDYWIVKVDAAGEPEWDVGLGGTEAEALRGLVATPDGGCLAAGWSPSGVSGNKTTPSFGGDYWIVKLDHAGVIQAEAVLGGGAPDALSTLAAGPSGDYLAAGRSQTLLPSVTKTALGWGTGDYWIASFQEHVEPFGRPLVLVNGQLAQAPGVTVTDAATVVLTNGLPDWRVFYTLDGSAAGTNSTEFTALFTLTNSATIGALAVSPDLTQTIALDPAVRVEVTVEPPRLLAAASWGNSNQILLTFSEPLLATSTTNINNYVLDGGAAVLAAAPDPADNRRVILITAPLDSATAAMVAVNGVTDLAGHAALTGSSAQLDTRRLVLADAGEFTPGFQDDFDATARDAGWVPSGPGGDVYTTSNGVLRVGSAAGDPNQLLYQGVPYDPGQQEILARIRVVDFGTGDGPRGGVTAGCGSQGFKFLFRNEGTLGPHLGLLDDLRAWGPALDLDWTTNQWYWLRLRYQPNPVRGNPDVLGRIWSADGSTPEPLSWLAWDRFTSPSLPDRYGYAGVAAGSAGGLSQFDVDYVLIKAAGLPTIRITPLAAPLPPLMQAIGWMGDGAFRLLLTGRPGEAYRVEWSDNLESWHSLSQGVWTTATAEVIDPGPPSGRQRFYRTTVP